MKIGIDARFLSHPQRGGFKTYTENLISSLSAIDNDNDYFIYLDRTLPEDKFPQKKNWHYAIVPGTFPVFGMPLREQVFLKRQIANDRLDVVHFLCNTAPINLAQRYVVTLHDTIQVTTIKESKQRLHNRREFKQWALQAYSGWAINSSIRSADRIITVSNFEKKQICLHFDISSERIAAIHLAPNPVFKPFSDSEKILQRSTISQKYGIKKKFILGIGYESRKNIEFLIEIYSKLVLEFEHLDLVLVCANEGRKLYFASLAEKLGLAGRIIILSALPAAELAIMYNLAEAFLYPSERESFGLPPLEAISCGAPTIAMNATSVPEILGNGAVLIDGKDHHVWVNTFRYLMTDDKARSRIVHSGLERASEFSWQRCAMETIQVYSDIAEKSLGYAASKQHPF